MPFQKGNKEGSKQRRLFGDALRRISAQNPERIAKLAEQLMQWAEAGEQWAFKEMVDRLDGKPHQTSDVTYNKSDPVEMNESEILEEISRCRAVIAELQHGTAEQDTGEGESAPVHGVH